MTFLIELVQSVKEPALMKELRVERMFPLSLVCVKFTSHVSGSLLSVREGEREERKGEDRMLVVRGVEVRHLSREVGIH